MQYSIKNTLIPIPASHEQPLLATLAMYDKGENLTNSPLIKSRINLTHKDVALAEDKEAALQEKQKTLIVLYENIKANGYNGSPILVWFDEDGFIHLYDGYHRLSVMKHLGVEVKVVCETEWSGINGAVGKDFPLAEVLIREPPEGKWLYQPVDDERVKDWELGRVHTPERLNHIAQNLVGKTVLDIGCSEGYFSRELAKRGYKVTAIDNNKGLLASARYLSTIGSIDVDYHLVDDWKNFVGQNGFYDNILFLSVIHNDMKVIGVEEGLKKLETLRGKADRLFLEGPYYEWGERTGKHGFTGKPPFNFSAKESVVKMEEALSSEVIEKWSPKPGSRPIYTFGDGSKINKESLVLEPNVNGYPMYLFKDEKWITPCLIKYHEAESQSTNFVKKQLKPGQTFVDCGAHVGYYTILASKIVGESGKVYAFEPSTSNFEVLKANIQLNKCSNVVAINKALLDKTGRSKLYRMNLDSHGQLYLQEGLVGDKPLTDQKYGPKDVLAKNDYEEVETVRLDEVLSISPDMVKLDVEGSEMLAIRGMEKLLEKPSDMVMLVEDLTGDSVKYLIDKYDFAAVGKPDRWNHILRRVQQPWWSLERWLQGYKHQYRPLFNTLKEQPCRNIMEVGVSDGRNAVAMIKAAALKVPEEEIHYYGFDLFEDENPIHARQEYSPIPTQKPTERDLMSRHLDTVSSMIGKYTTAKVSLFKGNTRKTLPSIVSSLPKMDLIYIDGGHSIETTRSDWKYSQRLMDKHTVVYFDDYNDEMPFIGPCFIVDELPPKYVAEVLPRTSYYRRPFGRQKCQLLKVVSKSLVTKKASEVTHYRFHLLGLAHSKTTKDWVLCPMTQLTYKMAQMLTDMGHEVYHYGTEGSNPPCTEQVDVLTEKVQKQAYGDWDPKKQLWIQNGGDLAYTTFRKNAIDEILLRKEPKDILLASIGNWQKEVSEKTGILTVEPYVGYIGCFAKFKVFPSYAWMHHLYGMMTKSSKENFATGQWYDAVIPHYFNPDDFEFSDKKEDYFFYVGRFITRKGVHVASQVTERLGAKLVAAGQLLYPDKKEECLHQLGMDKPHVEYVGTVNREERNKLMARAKAVFVPSLYLEPFGKVVVEALLCGTPVITTDWGAFPEIVKHGEVGYRCRAMDDFTWAANNVDKISPKACREYAVKNFSMERIGKAYQEYFMKIHDLFGKGWYAEHLDRDNLDWIKRY